MENVEEKNKRITKLSLIHTILMEQAEATTDYKTFINCVFT